MEIVLTGFMGSGKTTVSSLLADQLDLAFWDLDSEIVRKTGCGVADLFAQRGEEYFRQQESEILQTIIKNDGVLAIGGGTPVADQNMQILRDSGAIIVLLEARIETIWQRLAQDNSRPLAKNLEQLTQLKQSRQAKYQSLADFTVVTDELRPMQIVQEIVKGLNANGNFKNARS